MKIKIKKNNQEYVNDLIKKYPKIKSGRKNYKKHYYRILTNILLSKGFNNLSKEKFFLSKKYMFEDHNYLYLTTKNKKD